MKRAEVAIHPEASPLTRYGYDPRLGRYRDNTTGRFLGKVEIRRALDSVIDAETVKARDLATSLALGKLTLADWQVQMTGLLKSLHVASGLVANGGLKNISAADLGWLASQVKQQYAYLRTMSVEIRQGKQALDGTLASRSALYTQAARGTYEQMMQRLARNGGVTLSRSVLGVADHCDLCLSEASRGWIPIGENIPIGQRTCLTNCRCYLEFK